MTPYLKHLKVGFIGAGNMTRSLISGLQSDKQLVSKNIYVTSRSSDKAKKLCHQFNLTFSDHSDPILDDCDWVVLALKPQDLPDFLESYGKSFTEEQTVLSLCAGISLESLESQLPQVKNFCRLMPSTAAEFSSGVLGVYSKNEKTAYNVGEYFKSTGKIQITESEEHLDAIMISAASGAGFFLEILQIWSEWLEEMGFSKEDAEEVARSSFTGVSKILENSNKSLISLQSNVLSKKGVTIAGLEAMRASGLENALSIGFASALKRSSELSKLL